MVYTLRGISASIYLALNSLFWCLLLYLVGILRLPWRNGSALHLKLGNVMDRIIDGWVGCNKLMVHALGVTRIQTTPQLAALQRDRWYIVVSNHQTWADIIILQVGFLGHAPPLKFFTKKELIWLPLIGLAMWFLGFPYVHRFSRQEIEANPELRQIDHNATMKACAGFLERPTSVLNFLEGSRFSAHKRADQQSPYTHLLLPKVGGLANVANALDARIEGVVDATIVYPTGIPTFWDFLCGRCPETTLAVTLHDKPPSDRDALKTWVDAVWQDKDNKIANGIAASHADSS